MRSFFLALVTLAFLALSAHADEVYVRSKDKPYKGTVKDETAKEIVIGKDAIPASDVVDVEYDIRPGKLLINVYRPAMKAAKELNDPTKSAKHKENIELAIKSDQAPADAIAAPP